jgi:hypothetical protein
MRANDSQVGGNHYKTKYEHWDLVIETGMDYLAGQATKYIARWRKKNGLQDLEKARHYVVKLQENGPAVAERNAILSRYNVRPSLIVMRLCVDAFVAHNQLSGTEADIVQLLVMWKDPEELDTVLVIIDDLARRARWEADLVPATDSNKHAPRAGRV